MTVRLQRAHLLLRQSRPDEAVTELRSELADDPRNAEALGLLAICLAMREAWDEATAAARQAIGVAPDWAFPHYAMARVLEDRGQLDGAEQAIAEAIRLDPRHAGFFVTLARIRLEKGNWSEALAAAEHAQNLDPEDTGAANLRAMALVKLGRKADARSALGSSLAREPDNALTHANQGWALLHADDSRRALTHFQEALRIDPTLDWARQGLVEALKARNPLYRLLLRYFLWMSRLSPRASWAVLLGAYVVFRFLGPLWWLYLLLVLVTWTAEPLSDLLLRLSRYGRLLLSREEIVASNWLGATLAVAAVAWLAGLVVGSPGLDMGGFAVAVLAIPLSATFNCEPGWPRRTMAAYAAGCAALIALGAAVTVAGGDHRASPLILVGAVAAALGSWLGNILAGRRVRR